VIVVTHSIPKGWPREGSTVSLVTDGIESAMKEAEAIAGDGVIALGSPSYRGFAPARRGVLRRRWLR